MNLRALERRTLAARPKLRTAITGEKSREILPDLSSCGRGCGVPGPRL